MSGQLFSGTQFTDVVRVGDFVAVAQGLGSATTVQGFQDVDGVLG